MSEIKVGEFVRLKNGIILKYGEKSSTIIENNIYTDYSGEYEWSSEVVKHSSNIIDLVGKGDYVNGYRVVYVDNIEDGEGNENLCVFVEEVQNCIEKEDIKSILTKEQYQSVEYRLEE